MEIEILKSKLHRGTVTDANLEYEGSVSIDRALCDKAQLYQFEKVDIYNINNGARISTYVIYGNENEICLNGAAARHAQPGDRVIIVSYCKIDSSIASTHLPSVILLDEFNNIKAEGGL